MMKLLAKLLSMAALGLLTVPAVLYLAGQMSLEKVKTLMLIATILWFVVAVPKFCQKRDERN
jgi:hypothetical protein